MLAENAPASDARGRTRIPVRHGDARGGPIWLMLLGLTLALALGAPSPGEVVLAGSRPSLALDLRSPIASRPQVAALAPAPGRMPAPCQGDVCQPRVAVPGFEPRLSTRGKRTELFLRTLDRLGLEPFATAARYLAATGLRLDVAPPTRAGPAHFEVFLRLRLDAWGAPVPLFPSAG